ncbi:MAG: AI-2E family transporter [Mangrovicoccus sp.]|nr:AI-2E family transporter [Mangrovicoccus sp.]
MSLRDFFFITTLTVLLGYVLIMAQAVLLPIVIALMLAYVLVGAVESLSRFPVTQHLPRWSLFTLVLAIFVSAVTSIGLVAFANLRNIAASAPAYQANIRALITRLSEALDLGDLPTWEALRALTLDRIDLAATSLGVLSSLASVAGYTVLIATYVVFLVAERGAFDRKMSLLFGDASERDAAVKVVGRINQQIVTYLFTKTVVNIILGVISYVLMLFLGIQNAVFWAFLIAIFNYIPYVGSLMGVGVVVLYTLAQFGALRPTLAALVVLTSAQVYVGNFLEPRVMARSLNLSPFVVLAALVVWSAIWGLPGAIIAVPMTSISMIVLSGFEKTRAIPILLSRDGEF